MSTSDFQLAFNVDVSHSYFKNNICSCLQYSYGPVSSALAARFDLKIRKRVSGFGFYISARGTLGSFLQYAGSVTGQTYFDFDISSVNPAFNSFTESPAAWLGAFVYDSNSPLNTTSGNTVQLVAGQSPNTNTSNTGILRVHFNDILNGAVQYTISYEARATQWQYFIVNNSSVSLQNPSISGQAGVGFTGPENVTIETGQQALLFTTGENLLPITEIPQYKFNLLNNPPAKSGQPALPAQIVFKGLPNPDPVKIGMEVNGAGSQVTSPMYVYV